ncbi:pectin lyase-like protein [Teratosphaeria nubilosa]|uniref:Pectin lyase-like protein n=1 Tax=Teratosphaeria nubilosa TaxID=161662 RepID=A0A6G1KWS4_9PEZI|nr:pectin lyase-like protein [Teratosphaeria nubilosa]
MFGNNNTDYKVYRNIKDYGATGDGSTDDTNAINYALSDGDRCLVNCNSSTTSQAIVFFPPGTYRVHAPIVMPYYTQVIGDANNLPTVKATSNFSGMAVFDADPYTDTGANDFINQNNFFRQMRNMIIDLTDIEGTTGAGIHWQVAQATSLQNIIFNMKSDAGTAQQGIFMDNGSGGFMSDLIFNGGLYGAFLGSQQFTSRNLTFNNCSTAIYMNWNWGWTLSGITVNGGNIGIDASNSPTNQTVGSTVLADSTFSSTYGVKTAFLKGDDVPSQGGTLVLDNVDLSKTTQAIIDNSNNTILDPGHITSWVAGSSYDRSFSKSTIEGTPTNAPTKPTALLTNNVADGTVFGRSKPQYEGASSGDFLLSKTQGGCIGDGKTDATLCINSFLQNAASENKIAYFEHGVYLVTDTITIPPGSRIVGELWSTVAASNFSDASNPKPVIEIGTAGSNGTVEISDMLFEIIGPNPGAIMVQWNMKSPQGASGMWDTHIRMGGSYGSELLLDNCDTTKAPSASCMAGFMMFHGSSVASGIYLENTWFWTADHDMEDPLNRQISIYNGRGMLIEAQGPVWLWGTSCEHSIIYNYQFDGVQALFAGFMQSETPYFQPNPAVPSPLIGFNNNYDDPTFTVCTGNSTEVPCKDAWGLRVVNSRGVLIYSAGFYSFFNDYTQDCLTTNNCQENMIRIQSSQISAFAVTTIGTVNMLVHGQNTPYDLILASDNKDVYGSTVAYIDTTS